MGKESEYGVRGLLVLARRPPGTVMQLGEIAEAGQLPPGFLARIFQKLRRHDLVASRRGAVRGYHLSRPPRGIKLAQIIEAIEGQNFFERCIYRYRPCDERKACDLHTAWLPTRARLQHEIEHLTLADLAEQRGRRGGRAGGRRRKGAAS